jgi:mono/diheme cytochrome c family protein
VTTLATLSFTLQGVALPFNDDMVDNQLKTGEYYRARPEGGVAVGSRSGAFPVKLYEKSEVEKFINPKPGDAFSIKQGQKLYDINCLPCHGSLEHSPHQPGVAGKMIGAPDLRLALYKEKSDASLYGTIYFGGMAIMPGYGWKISPAEHWDIINYLRAVQDGQLQSGQLESGEK